MMNEQIENAMENLEAMEITDEAMEAVTGGKSRRYIEGDTGKSHVRTGPGLDYRAIGILHKGEQAKYLGKTSTDDRGVVWYKIRWDSRDAWVSSRYTCKVWF